MITIRRLGVDDEAVLTTLAHDNADFDVAGRSEAEPAMSHEAANWYLSNPAVLHWVAEADGEVVGTLYCLQVPLSHPSKREVLLYEIGVRSAWRRQGVGRLLFDQMKQWMQTEGVTEVWVLADNPEAVAFYANCGFTVETEQPVYMVQSVE